MTAPTTAPTTKKVTVEQPFKPRNMGREPISNFFGPMAVFFGLMLIASAVYFSRNNQDNVTINPQTASMVPAVSVPTTPPQTTTLPAPTTPANNSGIHIQGSHNSVTLNNNPDRVVERVIEKPVYVDRYLPQQPKIERVVEKTVVGPALIVVKPTESTQHSVYTTDPHWAQKHAEYVQQTNQWKAMFNR